MPRPRLARLRELFWDQPTGTVELAVAVMLALRGTWMLTPSLTTLPLEVQGYLIPPWFTESEWGTVLAILACCQILIACARWWQLRSVVATLVALAQATAGLGYWRAGLFYRGVVPYLLGIVVLEVWIAWRALHDHYADRRFPERRHP